MFNKKNHQLSIVIPILNEAKNINILIPKIVNCIKNKIKKYGQNYCPQGNFFNFKK